MGIAISVSDTVVHGELRLAICNSQSSAGCESLFTMVVHQAPRAASSISSVQSLSSSPCIKAVLIHTDNMTAMYYKQKRGDTLSNCHNLHRSSGGGPYITKSISYRTPSWSGSDCRPAQQAETTDSQVGTPPSSSPPILSDVGLLRHRSVRHTPKRKMPKLRLQVSTPIVQRQCTMDELVRDICLRFSTSLIHSNSGSEAQANILHSNPRSSHIGPSTVVHHPVGALSSTSSKATSHIQSPHKEPWRDKTPRSQTSQPSDLASEVIEFGYLNLPPDCMNIIKETRRPTTRACYAAKWKCFVIYCNNNHINPLDASVQNIIFFLLHLQHSILAYTSIRLHLAPIAAYL